MSDLDTLTAALRPIVDKLVEEKLAKLTKVEEYLTAQDAAQLADVNPGTIRRWVREGKLTEHRAGAHVRVSRADLERMLRTGTRRVANAELTVEERVRRKFG